VNGLKVDTLDLTTQPPALPCVLHEDFFRPTEPTSLQDSGLSPSAIESILSQILLTQGTQCGRKLSEQIGLPFGIVDEMLCNMRVRQIVAHARPAPFNDYYFSLTEQGHKRTLQHQQVFKYTGIAPVTLSDYILSVEAQANQVEAVHRSQLIDALEKISYDPSWLDCLGPAINGNEGIFFYGPPGNGKTTLAKCLSSLRGDDIWIPHAIIDDGMIIKFFDPTFHIPASSSNSPVLGNVEGYDRRWIKIIRPTVIVGGELTLDSLEIRHEPRSNTCEAPIHLKSNCGSLLIDDFGRQRVSPEELLNRWIVPLENKIDYLSLPTGKKISVPFEQMVLFSTNLQPQEIVDDAFLRRVPYKMEIRDPSDEEFIGLFRRNCEELGFPWRPQVVEQLLHGFFKANQLPIRRCYARDLLKQVKAYCNYRDEPLDLRLDYFKNACRNYFGCPRPKGNGQPSESRSLPHSRNQM
jgi:DNA polymerase III delta prime subunit